MASVWTGAFNKRVTNFENVTIEDLHNPWTFFGLFGQSDDIVQSWKRKNGLLAESIKCLKNGHDCVTRKREREIDGMTLIFRCAKNRNHEYTLILRNRT